LDRPSDIELRIHDVAGRLVRVIERGRLPAGVHRLSWDGRDRFGRDAPHGIYLATLTSGSERVAKKLVKLH
jgi:flagellar basal-body rod modification protein FlgD